MGTVALYDATYENATEIIEKAFADFNVNLANKTVVVKPNILGPFAQARAVTTHPAIVSAVVRALRSRGAARIMVGDNPGFRAYGCNELCTKESGIYDVCADNYVNLSMEGVSIPCESRYFEKVTISRSFLEADYYISLPKFKTHILTTLTGAIKNSFGMLVGGQKSAIHRLLAEHEKFSEAVVDIYQIRKPDLVVMDAVVGMEGKGPSCRDLRDIGKIMVSDNGVELDAVMAAMMGLKPSSVPMLRIAAGRGLGKLNPGEFEVVGSAEPIENFKLPSGVMVGPFGHLSTKMLTHLFVSRPVAVKDRCTKCGVCREHCPVGAISLEPYPVIDPDRCISCFCCMELCPESALEVTKKVKRFRGRLKF